MCHFAASHFMVVLLADSCGMGGPGWPPRGPLRLHVPSGPARPPAPFPSAGPPAVTASRATATIASAPATAAPVPVVPVPHAAIPSSGAFLPVPHMSLPRTPPPRPSPSALPLAGPGAGHCVARPRIGLHQHRPYPGPSSSSGGRCTATFACPLWQGIDQVCERDRHVVHDRILYRVFVECDSNFSERVTPDHSNVLMRLWRLPKALY
jgi:hypothetical protein